MRRLSLAFAAIMMTAASPVAHSATPDPDIQAEADNPRARMLVLEQAVQNTPNDMALRLRLSKVLIELGEYERASQMAELAMRRTGSLEARLVVADVWLRQGKMEEASTLLAEIDELGPDGAALKAVLTAENYLSSGNGALALASLGPAAAHETYGALARVIAARAYYIEGDLSSARRLTDEIIARGGDSLTALHFRAQLALRAGDTGAARRLAEGINMIDPGNVSAGTVMIEALMREGDIEAAQDFLSELKPRSPDDPRPAYLEGLVLLAQGDGRAAALAVSRIEEWLELTTGGALFLASVKQDRGLEAQAESILRRRLTADPTDIAILQELVSLLDKAERSDEADEVMRRAFGLMPGHPYLTRLEADRLATEGLFDQALGVLATSTDAMAEELFWRDATKDSNSAIVARMLVALRNNAPERALEFSRKAAGDAPLVMNLKAASLARQGEIAASALVLDDLILAEPDFLAAIINRASLEGRPDSLAKQLQQAINNGAESSRIHRQLAVEEYVLGHTDSAIAAVELAQAAVDTLPADQLLKARILMAEGRNDAAADLLRTVDPDTEGEIPFLLDRSWYLHLLGYNEDAAEYAAALQLPQDNVNSALRLIEIIEAAGEQNKARTLISAAREVYPTSSAIMEAHILLLARQDKSMAMSELETIEGLSTSTRIALEAQILIAADEARAAKRLLEVAPKSGPIFATMLQLAETAAEKRSLLEEIARYADANPADVGILVLLSGVALDVEDRVRAERALTLALAASPRNPAVFNNLALTRSPEMPEEALRLAAEAYRLQPEEPAFAETYASLLVEAGDTAKAGRIARRALLADPSAVALVPFVNLGR